ncbi:transcriptional regulator [Streptomyces nigrescens]|uniref:Transcriptional regulator n=1 Tax=Streptomyces nigrescens TaxID=1920 RepID=A0ABN6QNG2_STRNI|nr:helix-turn-helix domain-containing protein [Streptomyces nigrescens]BDM67495.1 transcriptional regulator [Streptomyces nigrescens]
MDEAVTRWAFVTNHARVLVAIARDPAVRIRDIAAACGITERTVLRVVADLEEGGYLSRERRGLRTHYTVHLDGMLRHPADGHVSVRTLVSLLSDQESCNGVARLRY